MAGHSPVCYWKRLSLFHYMENDKLPESEVLPP